MYSNNDITLSLHKQCFGGAGQDFVIRFKKRETCIKDIISISSTIVKNLINDYQQKGKVLKGRLVARVLYTTMNNTETIMYYHPSFQSELIQDTIVFYTEHMTKIAQRMDDFNRHGSNLIIDTIDEIHLHFKIEN